MCDIVTGLENVTIPKSATAKLDSPGSPADFSLNLLDMPLEIFLKICSYLDADFISTLSAVCRRFDEILADSSLWRCWVSRRLRHRYPALRHLAAWHDGEPNWEEACIDIDRETRRWRNVGSTMNHVVVRDVHYATVDSVLLINNGDLCVSGGRDRGLALCNVRELNKCARLGDGGDDTHAGVARHVTKHLDAHRGWVWDLAADDVASATTVYSGSWDNTVKSWDLATNLDQCKETFDCKMSVLAVIATENLVMAGLYSRQVLTFDVRQGTSPITSYKVHKGPVLKLEMKGDLIASLSEDRSIAVWDRRAGKALATDIRFTGERAYPICLSWSSAAMYVGDSKGSLHLVDPETYVHRGSYELWPEPPSAQAFDKVTGIAQSLGSLVVGSDRGEVKCLYPSDPTQEYASFQLTAKNIARLQYQNNILVIGTCESTIEFWIPFDRDDAEEQADNLDSA